MPTYSYICDGCGKSFEKEQRISEDPIKKCIFCGKAKAKRQITSGNFILKGGGWYSDGYGGGGSSAKSKASTSSSSSSSESSSSSTTKSEPAAKPDTSPSKAQAAD